MMTVKNHSSFRSVSMSNYWVVGGAEIYKKFLSENLVDSIYLSKFAEDKIGDTYFPKSYLENFKLKYINYCNGFKQEVYESNSL